MNERARIYERERMDERMDETMDERARIHQTGGINQRGRMSERDNE